MRDTLFPSLSTPCANSAYLGIISFALLFKFLKSETIEFISFAKEFISSSRSAIFSSTGFILSLRFSKSFAKPDIAVEISNPIPAPITALSAVCAILNPIVAAFVAISAPR